MLGSRRLPFLVALVLASAFYASRPAVGRSAGGPFSITGVVWQDDNGDGVRQADEHGIPAFPLGLDGPGVTDDVQTDAAGRYEFDDLGPGRYTVRMRYPFGYAETFPARVPRGTIEVGLTLATASATDVDLGLYNLQNADVVRGTAWIDAAPAPTRPEAISPGPQPDVRALIGGVDCTVTGGLMPPDLPPGAYLIGVAPAELIAGCGVPGAMISFTVNGSVANEVTSWVPRPPAPAPALSRGVPPPPLVPTPGPSPVAQPSAPTGRRIILNLTVGPPFAVYYGRIEPVLDPAIPRIATIDAFIGNTHCGSGYNLNSPPGYVVVLSDVMRPGCGYGGADVSLVANGVVLGHAIWTPGFHSDLVLVLPPATPVPAPAEPSSIRPPSVGEAGLAAGR